MTIKSINFHWLLSSFNADGNVFLVLANNKNKPLSLPILHHLTDDEKNFLTSNNINWEYVDGCIYCIPNPNTEAIVIAPLYIARQDSDSYELYGMYKSVWVDPRQIQKENELLKSYLGSKILIPGCYVDMNVINH